MAKNLKLMGIVSFTGAATMKGKLAEVVYKGEIARFPDEVAEKLMEGGRSNAEGEWVSYWQLAPDDVTPNRNFTKDENVEVKKLTDEERALVVAASQKKPSQRVARRKQ